MKTTTHTIKGLVVRCTRLHQAIGTSPYHCVVFRDGQQILAVTIPEADSPEEAAREARAFIV